LETGPVSYLHLRSEQYIGLKVLQHLEKVSHLCATFLLYDLDVFFVVLTCSNPVTDLNMTTLVEFNHIFQPLMFKTGTINNCHADCISIRFSFCIFIPISDEHIVTLVLDWCSDMWNICAKTKCWDKSERRRR